MFCSQPRVRVKPESSRIPRSSDYGVSKIVCFRVDRRFCRPTRKVRDPDRVQRHETDEPERVATAVSSSLARRRDHEQSQSGRRRTAWSLCASVSALVGISGGVEPDALGRCPSAGAFPGFGSLSADSCWCSNSPGSPPSPTSSSVLYMGSAISRISQSRPLGSVVIWRRRESRLRCSVLLILIAVT